MHAARRRQRATGGRRTREPGSNASDLGQLRRAHVSWDGQVQRLAHWTGLMLEDRQLTPGQTRQKQNSDGPACSRLALGSQHTRQHRQLQDDLGVPPKLTVARTNWEQLCVKQEEEARSPSFWIDLGPLMCWHRSLRSSHRCALGLACLTGFGWDYGQAETKLALTSIGLHNHWLQLVQGGPCSQPL